MSDTLRKLHEHYNHTLTPAFTGKQCALARQELKAYLFEHAEHFTALIEAATEFRDDYKQGKSTRTMSRGKLFSALKPFEDAS